MQTEELYGSIYELWTKHDGSCLERLYVLAHILFSGLRKFVSKKHQLEGQDPEHARPPYFSDRIWFAACGD